MYIYYYRVNICNKLKCVLPFGLEVLITIMLFMYATFEYSIRYVVLKNSRKILNLSTFFNSRFLVPGLVLFISFVLDAKTMAIS